MLAAGVGGHPVKLCLLGDLSSSFHLLPYRSHFLCLFLEYGGVPETVSRNTSQCKYIVFGCVCKNVEIVEELAAWCQGLLACLPAAVARTSDLGHGGESKPRRKCVGHLFVVCCMTDNIYACVHNGSQFRVQVDVKLWVMEEGARSSAITIQLTEESQLQDCGSCRWEFCTLHFSWGG